VSLLTRLEKQEERVRKAAFNLSKEKLALRELELKRLNCAHIFSKPVLNYEHEGGYCTKCGINELYAYTLANEQRTTR
jgi:hypothetical protein